MVGRFSAVVAGCRNKVQVLQVAIGVQACLICVLVWWVVSLANRRSVELVALEDYPAFATSDEVWELFKTFLRRMSGGADAGVVRYVPSGHSGAENGSLIADFVPLFVITPTYPRPLQIVELSRLANSFKGIRNLLWIVCDDTDKENEPVVRLLKRSGLRYHYLLSPAPVEFKDRSRFDDSFLPKGVTNRNAGLEFVLERARATKDLSGVVYFADDDNFYDDRLFDELRKTRRVSAFPVGFVSRRPVSTPVLDLRGGQLVGFYDGWIGGRKFPVDMAGFAFSVRHLVQADRVKRVSMPHVPGHEEDLFLKQLGVEPENLEFLAKNCTEIYVWHVKTEPPSFEWYEDLSKAFKESTNLGILSQNWDKFLD